MVDKKPLIESICVGDQMITKWDGEDRISFYERVYQARKRLKEDPYGYGEAFNRIVAPVTPVSVGGPIKPYVKEETS